MHGAQSVIGKDIFTCAGGRGSQEGVYMAHTKIDPPGWFNVQFKSAEARVNKVKIKPRYSLDELMANTDFEAIANDEYIKDWLEMKPAGRESE